MIGGLPLRLLLGLALAFVCTTTGVVASSVAESSNWASFNAPKTGNPVHGLPRVGSANKPQFGKNGKFDAEHGFSDIIDNYASNARKFTIPTKGPGGKVVRNSDCNYSGPC